MQQQKFESKAGSHQPEDNNHKARGSPTSESIDLGPALCARPLGVGAFSRLPYLLQAWAETDYRMRETVLLACERNGSTFACAHWHFEPEPGEHVLSSDKNWCQG